MLKRLKDWWQNNHPITQLELKQSIHPIQQATADIEIMMANNIEKSVITKKDLYQCAVLAGLLARGGVIGGSEHNANILQAASEWFNDL
jgi:hypothetical protein